MGLKTAPSIIEISKRLREKKLEIAIADGPELTANINGRLLWHSGDIFEADNSIEEKDATKQRLRLQLKYRLYDGKYEYYGIRVADKKMLLQKKLLAMEKIRISRKIFESYLIAVERKKEYLFYEQLLEELERLAAIIRAQVKSKKLLPYVQLKLKSQMRELDYMLSMRRYEYKTGLNNLVFLTASEGKQLKLTHTFADNLTEDKLKQLSISDPQDSPEMGFYKKKIEIEAEHLKQLKREDSITVNLLGSIGVNNSFSPTSPLIKGGIAFQKDLGKETWKKVGLARVKKNNAAYEYNLVLKKKKKLLVEKAGMVKVLNDEVSYRKSRVSFLAEKYRISRLRFGKGKVGSESLLGYFRDYYRGYETFVSAKIKLYTELGGITSITGKISGIIVN